MPPKKSPATENPRLAIIMAGGSGERFWPLSRATRPKQLLRLTSETHSLIEEAVERLLPMFEPEHIFVATSRILRPVIRRSRLPIPAANVLAEPAKRNTAGCLAWVAAEIMARFPGADPSLAIVTADHLIGKPEKFRAKLKAALREAENQGTIVTLGIEPDRPEEGYGYIEVPKERLGDAGALPVFRFREKPSLQLAEEFLAAKNFFWNSGMFFWKISTFLREMELASPAHAAATRAIAEALSARKAKAAEEIFLTLTDISIDYALLEKSKTVSVVRADFPWDDVGAWDALERTRPSDANGNVVEGDPVLVDAKNCVVLNELGAKMAVGVIGVENLVVIVTRDAVLVVPKSKAQEVRHIPRALRKRGAKQV